MKKLLLIALLLTSLHSFADNGGLPPGATDADIGSPGQTGSASLTNGVWTVSGGGIDIWDVADDFNFVSGNLNADATIIAYVTSTEDTDDTGYSKAGVMFRDSLDPAAPNAFMAVFGSEGVGFQWRSTYGATCGLSQIIGISAPVWLKLTRTGENFTGYFSTDGVVWTQAGVPTPVEMGGNPLVGLAVTAHNDAALNTATFTNVTITPAPFGVYRELWTNLPAAAGNNLAALTNTTYNPGWPDSPIAYYTHIFANFEVETNIGMFYFGERLRTLIVPPLDGYYVFSIASQDASQLFLSTDESPTNIQSIAGVASATSFEVWTNFQSQQSSLIYLQAGCRYYLEAQLQDGLGIANLSVRWQLPNLAYETPLNAQSAAGTYLVPFTGLDATPGIYSQSETNLIVTENTSPSLSVLSTNQSTLAYQWFIGGVLIPGATLPAYTLTNLTLAETGDTYFCVLTNSLGSITSAPVVVTVQPDLVPPAITNVFNLGSTNLAVFFSKPLDPVSALNPTNYNFTNGINVYAVSFYSNSATVLLTIDPLSYGTSYSLFASNIYDLASTPNVLTNTLFTFTALPYAVQEIGNPSATPTLAITTNGVNIVSGATNLQGFNDEWTFDYQNQTGDFDVQAQLTAFQAFNLWARAGLMARASLDGGSPFAATLATPGINGESFFFCPALRTGISSTGYFPINYPNTWLRLSRVGDLFTSYGSYDGTNWTVLGATSISMPGPIYVGLAVAGAVSNQLAAVQFQNVTPTLTNAVVNPTVNPHELLGPSSRKTGIVISEIMYKPAPRTDSNNVEFLEIYNSNPFFQDIGGYQVQTATMSYTFASGTLIPANTFFVLAASPSSISNVYGLTSNVFGPYTGSLKTSATLELLDERTNVLLTVPYTATYPWPVSAVASGHSIVLANPTYGEGDPRAWDISDVVGGSPGRNETFHPSSLRTVVINEILPHSESLGVPQFIELYNHSSNTVDLSGCILTDDLTANKFIIPSGTLIPPVGFVTFNQSQFGFTLNGAGETLYFINPDKSRILDAVQFGAQADGVSYGRWPDGANDFYAFTTNTPGTNNSPILINDIVINELMYDPITENDDDQYVELYNKGATNVDLSGWQFTSAITFQFPTNTVIPSQGYLVVSRNLTNLFVKYPNLNSANTVGDYSGKLSHSGEKVSLARPEKLYGTNTIYVEQDEVTYGTGGRWGQWAGGGGSSLELIDPRSNHRLAANWTDSDETQKSSWTNIEYTGVMDNGSNYEPAILRAQIGLLDVGECLIDDVEVDSNGTNYVANPDFETGAAYWDFQGCMVRSSVESPGYQSANCLHLRSSDRLWTGDNSCQVDLLYPDLTPGNYATLRFKARWLHGWPEALLRLNGNWLEATGALPIPLNLGSPGARNSMAVTNAGPAVYNVTHSPTLPAPNQAAVVTARVHDPDGVQSLVLYYRIDPATNYTAVPMTDDGTGSDAFANDGIYSATIPGQAVGVIAAFYLQPPTPRARPPFSPPFKSSTRPSPNV